MKDDERNHQHVKKMSNDSCCIASFEVLFISVQTMFSRQGTLVLGLAALGRVNLTVCIAYAQN